MKRTWLSVLFFIFICSSFALAQPNGKPKLVVFISVDQMRADYLERFAKEYTGGLKKLTKEGTVYTQADLNYATSETGPGHATLSTGSYPRVSGIPANEWIEPATRKKVYCVEDSTVGRVGSNDIGIASPKNLVVTAIGDWLKQVSPTSKVITASVKDRAAVLMGGKHPTYAFWYDRKTGFMGTSTYYTEQLPDWAQTFNASNWIKKNVPDAWTKMMPDSVYAKDSPDDMEGEFKWNGSAAFPHTFQPEKKKDQITSTPYGDKIVLDFAKEAIRAEKLGMRNVTDLLCISLSCTDYIGHSFGPNSHEMHDQMLNLDRSLGEFFTYLEQQVGKGNFIVALSADHAVMPLPEYRSTIQHQSAKRIALNKEMKPAVEAVDTMLRNELGAADPVVQIEGFLNYAAAAKAGMDSLAFEKRVRSEVLKINGVGDIYFRRELINKRTPDRPYLGKFQRSYYPPRGEDFQIRGCEYCLITSSTTGTSHGSAYTYDNHVPIVLWGKHIKPKHVGRPVHTVDIAPTLARIVGVPYPKTVSGKPLAEVLK